jgi:hypothetical protein
MRIYFEDMAAGTLVRLLRKAGLDVESPLGAGRWGRSDPVQLTFAIHESRLCLTANYDDYEELHFACPGSAWRPSRDPSGSP